MPCLQNLYILMHMLEAPSYRSRTFTCATGPPPRLPPPKPPLCLAASQLTNMFVHDLMHASHTGIRYSLYRQHLKRLLSLDADVFDPKQQECDQCCDEGTDPAIKGPAGEGDPHQPPHQKPGGVPAKPQMLFEPAPFHLLPNFTNFGKLLLQTP